MTAVTALAALLAAACVLLVVVGWLWLREFRRRLVAENLHVAAVNREASVIGERNGERAARLALAAEKERAGWSLS